MPQVLALFGPTATGKSAIAHALAREIGGEIVVADPFQRYRGLEIAADSPRPAERAEVRYHLVGDLDLHEDSTAGGYAARAHAAIDGILAAGRLPIVAGGTGLYLRAALCDLEMRPPPDPAVRAWAEDLVADLPAAVEELARRDPRAAQAVDRANPRRVARALERAVSGEDPATGDIWSAPPRVPAWVACVDRPPDVLDVLIARRVDRELADGLVPELRRALARPDLARGPQQVIGMAEVADMDAGTMGEDALPAALVARTRRLARMQRTWMRRMHVDCLIELGDGPASDAVHGIAAGWRRARDGVV